MDAGEKFQAGMWIIQATIYEQMSHREKTVMLKIAYRLIKEAMLSINASVILGNDSIPF